jgi:hypothetical protein
MTDEITRQNYIARKNLEYQVATIALTFCTIAFAVEAFIYSSPAYPDWAKALGGIILIILLAAFSISANNELKDIRGMLRQ